MAGKSNVHTRTGHESPEREYRCNSALCLISALDGVGVSNYGILIFPLGHPVAA
jgi:hypothetical protein